MKKLFIFFLCVTSLISAQNSSELFTTANDFYQNAKYDQAIDMYKKIIANGEVSSELYYNLGNCYYKLNDVAPTIYNYEKALQLDKSNTDAKNNLAYAKKMTLDRIVPLPETFVQQVDKTIFKKLSFEIWGVLALISSFFVSIFFLLYYFSTYSSKKRLFFVGSLVSLLLLVFSFIVAYREYQISKNTKYAIVFSKEVEVKNEPIPTSSEVFVLHEGTKVKLLDTVDKWIKIQIVNGKTGWIIKESVQEL